MGEQCFICFIIEHHSGWATVPAHRGLFHGGCREHWVIGVVADPPNQLGGVGLPTPSTGSCRGCLGDAECGGWLTTGSNPSPPTCYFLRKAEQRLLDEVAVNYARPMRPGDNSAEE